MTDPDYTTISLRIDRRNLTALIRNHVYVSEIWLKPNDDSTYALEAESPVGEQAYQGQANHHPENLLAQVSDEERAQLAARWAEKRDMWPEACQRALREIWEDE